MEDIGRHWAIYKQRQLNDLATEMNWQMRFLHEYYAAILRAESSNRYRALNAWGDYAE
jgi:hypothetical protein